MVPKPVNDARTGGLYHPLREGANRSRGMLKGSDPELDVLSSMRNQGGRLGGDTLAISHADPEQNAESLAERLDACPHRARLALLWGSGAL